MSHYEILPHPADIKVKIWAASRRELLFSALKALYEISGPQLDSPPVEVQSEIKATGANFPDLVVDFLSQVVSLTDVYNSAFSKMEIQFLSETELSGRLVGYRFKYLDKEIKGVSYHHLDYQEENGLCTITIIFDI